MEAALSPPPGERYRQLSLWWDGLPDPIGVRPSLTGDLDADVAVVGGGFTGLWTAYYLAEADPTLRIAVVERDVVGFGASGRNGGWCSALFAVPEARLDAVGGAGAGAAMRRAMVDTVGEVGRVAADEAIACGFALGGTVVLARSGVQLERASREVAEARAAGIGPEDLRLLSAAEASSMARATNVLGGTYTPHCAAVDPARLVRGLGEAAERRGVTIYEQTAARAVGPGAVVTEGGTVRAPMVVRATEGYTRTLRGEERTLVPVYSLMIATEPLPDRFWDQAGLAGRETFADHRHLVIYGQRTEDGRMASGGGGRPTTSGRPSGRSTTATSASTRTCARRWSTCSRPWPGWRSPIGGVGPSGSPATGSPRSGSIRLPDWPGPGATWATGCRPPTWPAGPCAT